MGLTIEDLYEKYAGLKPGKETDKIVAEVVFGGAGACYFQCPNCLSTHFGSFAEDGQNRRECHDEFGKGCSWSGLSEDALPDFSEDKDEAFNLIETLRPVHKTQERIWETFLYLINCAYGYSLRSFLCDIDPMEIVKAAIIATEYNESLQ
jgi:hypothetical protein